MNNIQDQIMAFQEFIMEMFYTYDEVNIIQQRLNLSLQDPVLVQWLVSQSPEMLEVAARMVQCWGKKSPVMSD